MKRKTSGVHCLTRRQLMLSDWLPIKSPLERTSLHVLSTNRKLVGALLTGDHWTRQNLGKRGNDSIRNYLLNGYEKLSFHKVSLVHSLWAEDPLLLLVQHLDIRLLLQNSICTRYRYPKTCLKNLTLSHIFPLWHDDSLLIQNAFRTRHKMWHNSFIIFHPEEDKNRLKQAYLEEGLNDRIFSLVSYGKRLK